MDKSGVVHGAMWVLEASEGCLPLLKNLRFLSGKQCFSKRGLQTAHIKITCSILRPTDTNSPGIVPGSLPLSQVLHVISKNIRVENLLLPAY